MSAFDQPTRTTEALPREPRLYAVTRGRTRVPDSLRLVTLLIASSSAPPGSLSDDERTAWETASGTPASVAEIAAAVRSPVWAAKILISDLLDSKVLEPVQPRRSRNTHTDPELLERVLVGLRQVL
jgi:hypothetical protein